MDIILKPLKVIYQGKSLIIDLQKELSINPNKLDSQLKEIPSSYYILCNIRDKYIRRRNELARKREETYSKAWTYNKENSNWNNDYVSHKANINKAYISVCKRYLKAEEKVNKFISICKAYESKENILRTLSANQRKY